MEKQLPERLAKELHGINEEFFNKALAIKKDLLPSMKEEELVFIHKRINELRKEIPSNGLDENFHIKLIMADAMLIVLQTDKPKSTD